jgi:hypothetical protein
MSDIYAIMIGAAIGLIAAVPCALLIVGILRWGQALDSLLNWRKSMEKIDDRP